LLERTPLASIEEAIVHKSVPRHRYSAFYFLGGMTLFFFSVQVVTGALLLLYYRPSGTEAYESVGFIMTRVPFGWLVRSVHAWSANPMIGAAFVHHPRRHRRHVVASRDQELADRHGGHGGEAAQAAGREDVGVHQEPEAGADRVRRRQSRRVSEDAAGQILMVTAPISDLPHR
jgi:hypothetical protein